MKNIYTKEDFENCFRRYVFEKLDQVAIKCGGLCNLINYFLNVPDEDSGLNYVYVQAEAARLGINNGLSADNIEIEIMDIKFDANMKLFWIFNLYVNIENTFGVNYTAHRLKVNERALLEHNLYDAEGSACYCNNGIKFIDWDLVTQNFVKLTKQK